MEMQRQAQRGAVTIMTVGFLLLAVLSLVLVVDTGRLYLEKRKLQRVADVSAIEAVARNGDCTSPGALAATYATQAAVRNGYVLDADHSLVAACGVMNSAAGERVFSVQSSSQQAIRVQVTHTVPASLIAGGLFGNTIELRATAVASKGVPLAALTLKTTLLSIDSTQSPVLNLVLGKMLGGSALTLDFLGYQGLLKTDLGLFSYLDLLKSDLGLTVGGYDQVLASDVTLTRLIDVAVSALQSGKATGGNSAEVSGAIAGLQALRLGVGTTTIKLGDLLDLQTGAQHAGVDANLNLFQLVEGSIMLANKNSALAVDVPLNVPGLGSVVTIAMQVIQPPQLSAVGNPILAEAEAPDFNGPNRIYVRSSQIRLYIGLSLGSLIQVTDNVLSKISGVMDLANPVSSFLYDVLGLNLVSAVTGLLNGLACDSVVPAWPLPDLVPFCTSRNVSYAKTLANNARVDIALQVGSGEGRVSAHTCGPSNGKTLTVKAKTSIADIRVGRIGSDTDGNGVIENSESRAAVFNGLATMPNAAPIPLLEFGKQISRPESCALTFCSNWQWFSEPSSWVASRTTATYYPQAGLALRIGSEKTGLGLTTGDLHYAAPAAKFLPNTDYSDVSKPEKAEEANFQSLPSSPDLLGTLGGLLSDVNLEAYQGTESGVIASMITATSSALNLTKDALQALLSSLLSPILDFLLNQLFKLLGLDLGKTEIGANLSCSSEQGVVLVQ